MLQCVRWQARVRAASRAVIQSRALAPRRIGGLHGSQPIFFHGSASVSAGNQNSDDNSAWIRIINSLCDLMMSRAAASAATPELLLVQQLLGLKDSDQRTAKLGDPILVCLDMEAYEFAHDKITEIGVSVLDPRDIKDIPSGENGATWLAKIASAHYLIKEHRHLVNRKFLKGYPKKFCFGHSQQIGKANAGSILKYIFNDPANLSRAHKLGQKARQSGRPIVVVGHALQNEDKFLGEFGISLASMGQIAHSVDTQSLVGSKKRPVALKNLLKAVDVDQPRYLHNAGNDAAYTLQALLLVALAENRNPGGVMLKIETQRQQKSAEDEARRQRCIDSRQSTEGVAPRQERSEKRREKKAAVRAVAKPRARSADVQPSTAAESVVKGGHRPSS